VQEMQMTSVMDKNVHNIAIEGNFDECQSIVKDIMGKRHIDDEIKAMKIGAVNSINWARILAQIVYYFDGYHQWLKLKPERKYGDMCTYVVPTGNFGNALAGYYASQLGLPIQRIVIATNANDILHRFISGGDYSKGEFKQTLAPAMDISIPSNFERYLFDLSGRSGEITLGWMTEIKEKGTFDLSTGGDKEERLKTLKSFFSSGSASDDQIHEVANTTCLTHFADFAFCSSSVVG